MPLSAGQRLGSYEIIAALGAGGMGEVYRARDTKLQRDVALKVLPPVFVSDPDRVARFEREARALAALNHPNIAHVYDTGRDGETVFIAMEFVDGEDLAARISRGRVPVAEAIAIARQIASGLEAAHEAGIIHRDLKPANIRVREDGTVKVLDFGLAKAAADSGVSRGSDMNSPTLTARGTELGLIIGTAAYMSPEQARGKPADRRADLWALGVVLYEMLTGKRAFEGPEVSDVLASVLKDTPPLEALPPDVPSNITRLLRRTLEKDRARRLDSMAAARLELENVDEAPRSAAPLPASSRTMPTIAVALAALVVGAVGTWLYFSQRTAAVSSGRVIAARIVAPPDVIAAFHDGFALSPDGTQLAFAARNPAGLRQIWLRRMDAENARPVPGTDSGTHPFWSPTGGSFGFFADGKIKRVNVDGSGLQTVCDFAGSFPQASWSSGDEILFAADQGGGSRIRRVRASGGTPTVLENAGPGLGATWFADGKRFVFAGGSESEWGLRVGSVDGPPSAIFAPMPYLLKQYAYAAGLLFMDRNDALVVQRLDEASGTLAGTPVPIALRAGHPKEFYAVSSDGTSLVALVRERASDIGDPGDPMARLVWVDRQGNTISTLGDPGRFWTMRLMPNGKDVVVNPSNDLWLLRPEGRHTRLTTGNGTPQTWRAIMSPNGAEMVYRQDNDTVRRRLEDKGLGTPLKNAAGFPPYDWSPDGLTLLLNGRADPKSERGIVAYDLATGTLRTVVATPFSEGHARFSPDGKWIGYTSNFSGQDEVYAKPLDAAAEPVQVSLNGGAHPAWRHDGTELYFLDPGDDLMVVTVTRNGGQLSFGKPQRLFRIPLNDITRSSYAPYEPYPDGSKFLLNVPDRPTPLFFLQGLQTLVR